jgi:exodeoxyribonuclease VII small subunit
MDKCMDKKSDTFEAKMKRLEEVVSSLETGQAPLEQALELFEEGVKLAGLCHEQMARAEQKVEVLVEKQGSWLPEPYTNS